MPEHDPGRAPSSLRPYMLRSLAFHAVLFGVISALLLAQGRSVELQEKLVIGEVKAEEDRLEKEENQARKAAAKNLLEDQLQAEMDALIVDELLDEHEQELSRMTEEDIEHQVADAESELNLDELSDEEFYQLTDELRGETFEQMRTNLRQMKQDLLLSQVRYFIRTTVAPEIKRRIEDRLRAEVAPRIDSEAATRSHSEKYARVNTPAQALNAAIRELDGLRRRQDEVASHVARNRAARAAQVQDSVGPQQKANTAKIETVLESIERLVPGAAEQARSLHRTGADDVIAPAVEKAGAAVAEAVRAADEEKEAPKERKAEAKKTFDEAKGRAAGLSREASARVSERVKELKQLAGTLAGLARDRKPDEIQREVVRQALGDVEEAVRRKVEKEVADSAIPIAAERIMKALEPDLEKRNLNNEKFRSFLEKDIRTALTLEMRQQKPDPKQAVMPTEARFQLRERKGLDEARREVAEAAARLRALAARQEALRGEIIKESAEKDARRQSRIVGDMVAARKEITSVLHNVRRATLRQAAGVGNAARKVADPKAENRGAEAATKIAGELAADAKDLMAEAADHLKGAANALDALGQGLAEEADEIEERAAQMDLAKVLSEETGRAAVQAVKQQAGKAVEERTPPAVARAANAVDVRNILNRGPETEALARMQKLEDKLDQVALNMQEGRALGDDLGLGMIGPGQGLGLGGLGSSDGIIWGVRYRSELQRLNREAYEEFVKDLRRRMNPDNYYAPEASVDGLDSVARPADEGGPALIFIGDAPADPTPDEPEQRTVPEPEFPFKAFGAAAMMERRPTIDGDLSDWGELRHPLRMQYRGDSLEKIEDGPQLYVRWSPDGLYFGYTVKDDNGIQPCKDHPWSGDCLEAMIDTANSRLPEAYQNLYAQKFCFTPFGCRGSTAVTVWEMGRGLRGMGMARDYPDVKGIKGKAASRIVPGVGYTVECFLSRRALVKPQLVPGRYLALNFSVNQQYGPGTQWSASQTLQTWRRPDTWGDLLLLGADARLKFIPAGTRGDAELKGIVPGEPLGVEITDADMNINTLRTDRIAAELLVKGSAGRLFLVLKETGHNSGVFRASVDTQHYFMPPRENTLNLRGGDSIRLVYTDARAEYGEKNREVTGQLPVGWPVTRVSGRLVTARSQRKEM